MSPEAEARRHNPANGIHIGEACAWTRFGGLPKEERETEQ
jgi:hypothetical protein